MPDDDVFTPLVMLRSVSLNCLYMCTYRYVNIHMYVFRYIHMCTYMHTCMGVL